MSALPRALSLGNLAKKEQLPGVLPKTVMWPKVDATL